MKAPWGDPDQKRYWEMVDKRFIPRLADIQKRGVVDLHLRGVPLKEIASRYGVSTATIRRAIVASDIPESKKKRMNR